MGKTGTSSSWRDAWFVGFTGALVTGVWVGHDDFRPMWLNGQGVTGGSLPATAWHAFMSVAHANRNIPPIQGLPPHPAQVAEQQRLAELKRTDPGLAQAQIAQATQKRSSIMPDQTRDAAEASGRQHAARRRPAGDAGQRAGALPAARRRAAAKARPNPQPLPAGQAGRAARGRVAAASVRGSDARRRDCRGDLILGL